MRLFEIIGYLIGFLFLLGGCTVVAVTMMPSNLLGALLIGGLFVLYPRTGLIWRIFSGAYLVVLIISAALLIAMWITVLRQRDNDLPLGATLWLIGLGLIAPILSGVSLLLSITNIDRPFRRFWCAVLQAVAVVAGWAYAARMLSIFAWFNS
jgi:hypothetical protein